MGRLGQQIGTGLLQGVSLGHGIQMDRAANERADQSAALQRQRFDSDQAYLQERRGMEAERFDWERGDREFTEDERDYTLESRKAKQQALRFKQAVYDDTGKPKDPSKWDRAILADIGNQMGMVKEFLAQNPDVDPDAPLLEVVPLKTGAGEKITFRLRRTDGGAGVLTENRTSDGNDPVVTLSPEEFIGEMEDIFAGYGIVKTEAEDDPLAEKKFDRETEMQKIKAKGMQDRKTAAAKPGADDPYKNAYKNLPEDVQSMLSREVVNDLTGETEYVLEPDRVNRFLNFWKNETDEKDPRKAVTTFNDAEEFNTLPAEEIKAQLDANPSRRKYMVSLMTAEKRRELRDYMESQASVASAGRGMQ